jgi:hypothetical protein
MCLQFTRYANTLPASLSPCSVLPAMNTSKSAICPKCQQPMRLALVKGMRGRKYRCFDCEDEDPLRSPDINLLLEQLRPPE